MKNKNIQISVIIVSLNTKKDFIKTIKSTLKQTFKNKEIIIVDGFSTDGTIDTINQLQNKSIKAIIEKDKGIYDAMNKGIKYSNGKWIIFMNSGDIFYNQNVLKNIFLKNINKYDILYGDTLINNNFFNYRVKAQNFSKKTVLMPFCHQSVFVKSNILKKKNFSLKYRFSSDFDFFNYCYLSKKKFQKINYIISKVKSGGFADKNRQLVFDENLTIIKKKGYKSLLYFLYLKKISQYLKDTIKFILPSFIQELIFKIKYKRFTINKKYG